MVTSPQVSWLFFKAVRAGLAVKRPYLSHTGRASNAEKQPTGRGPEGCVENGPAAALLVGYVSIKICALLAPCRRPILNATTSPLYARRYTRCCCEMSASASRRDNTDRSLARSALEFGHFEDGLQSAERVLDFSIRVQDDDQKLAGRTLPRSH